jgi:hypothetical protein
VATGRVPNAAPAGGVSVHELAANFGAFCLGLFKQLHKLFGHAINGMIPYADVGNIAAVGEHCDLATQAPWSSE